MKRYKLVQYEATEDPAGDWVRHEDLKEFRHNFGNAFAILTMKVENLLLAAEATKHATDCFPALANDVVKKDIADFTNSVKVMDFMLTRMKTEYFKTFGM